MYSLIKADCMNERRSWFKCIVTDKHLPSFIQFAVFTGCVARQTNHWYKLPMTVICEIGLLAFDPQAACSADLVVQLDIQVLPYNAYQSTNNYKSPWKSSDIPTMMMLILSNFSSVVGLQYNRSIIDKSIIITI